MPGRASLLARGTTLFLFLEEIQGGLHESRALSGALDDFQREAEGDGLPTAGIEGDTGADVGVGVAQDDGRLVRCGKETVGSLDAVHFLVRLVVEGDLQVLRHILDELVTHRSGNANA